MQGKEKREREGGEEGRRCAVEGEQNKFYGTTSGEVEIKGETDESKVSINME